MNLVAFRLSISLVVIVPFGNCMDRVQAGSAKQTAFGSSGDKQNTISTERSRLTKTQGTDQFAQVRCGIQDKKGNLWFGTSGEGVYRFNGKVFTQFTVKDGLSANYVQCIVEDRAGSIWFGTDAGLCRYDGKFLHAVPMSFDHSSGFFPSTGTNNDLSGRMKVLCALQARDGRLWFGTSEGVCCYDGTAFTRFLDGDGVINESGLGLKWTQYMLEDRKGNIWFGSGVWDGDGLSSYDGKSIKAFKPNGHGWIRYIVEDTKGIIWFGTRSDGNWRYDGKDFTQYTEKLGIGAPILNDKTGNIWFSGEEHDNGYGGKGGVWLYDGKSFKNFTTNDGMGDYGVWCILQDKTGNIWVGTRNVGLYEYNGKSFTKFSE